MLPNERTHVSGIILDASTTQLLVWFNGLGAWRETRLIAITDAMPTWFVRKNAAFTADISIEALSNSTGSMVTGDLLWKNIREVTNAPK